MERVLTEQHHLLEASEPGTVPNRSVVSVSHVVLSPGWEALNAQCLGLAAPELRLSGDGPGYQSPSKFPGVPMRGQGENSCPHQRSRTGGPGLVHSQPN